MRGQRSGHDPQAFGCSFHNIVTARTVNVHIDEAGDCDLLQSLDLDGTLRQFDGAARADSFHHTVAHQNPGVRNFGGGSEGAPYVQESGGHGERTIVAKIVDR